VDATLRRRSSMPARSTASSTMRAPGRLALRLAALHEGADAVDDLARALGLARGLLERGDQVALLDGVAFTRETMPLQ
jgi:hypothetical protein